MNPLMMAMQGANSPANKMGQISNIIKMLKSGNPEVIGQQLMQNNPQFRAFVQQNQGKSPEQVAKEHGIDFNEIVGMMK